MALALCNPSQAYRARDARDIRKDRDEPPACGGAYQSPGDTMGDKAKQEWSVLTWSEWTFPVVDHSVEFERLHGSGLVET